MSQSGERADLATPSWIAHVAEGWCRDCREICDGDDPDGMPCRCCVQAERSSYEPH